MQAKIANVTTCDKIITEMTTVTHNMCTQVSTEIQ